MISVLIYILVVCLIVGLIYWVADALPIPQPLNKIVKIVAMVIGCVVIIFALLGMTGYDLGWPPSRRP
jgi:hypothetical protein